MHRPKGSALKSELVNETSQPPHLKASQINVLHDLGQRLCLLLLNVHLDCLDLLDHLAHLLNRAPCL